LHGNFLQLSHVNASGDERHDPASGRVGGAECGVYSLCAPSLVLISTSAMRVPVSV
jgi:hypothetical protein